MKKSANVLIILMIAVFVCAAVVAVTVALQRGRIQGLERRVAELKSETIPLKFMILSRSDDSVSARIKLYDQDGAEVAKVEKTWTGSELYLDFLVLPAAGRYMAFPWRVFTDKTSPNAGTMLSPFYDEDGFPGVYGKATMDADTAETLRMMFGKALNGETPEGGFGSAVHDVRQIGSFETGVVYRVVTRVSGGLEIQVD